MPNSTQQEMSHADRHDLDKLARWQAGLVGSGGSGTKEFPFCAIFLVSPDHSASHDIFRRYRAEFEDLGGGFHHLVIFGQHGISTTLTAFLEELGRHQDAAPLLAIAPMSPENPTVFCVALPKGEGTGDLDNTQPWGVALDAVRQAASGSGEAVLNVLEGAEGTSFLRGTLIEAVSGVSRDLAG